MSGPGGEAPRRRPLRFTLASLFRCHRKHFNKRDKHSMLKVERTMKAALLIQRWYRQYVARMEIRRRYTWTIFQSIEYADEHAQLQLYNFYNALLLHIPNPLQHRPTTSLAPSLSQSSKNELDESIDSGPGSPILDINYKGPHLNSPLSAQDLDALLDNFKQKKPHRLHARYVALVLRQAVKHLRRLPNINEASTATAGQITIIGDLHGKLDDLLVVFHKNGLPSAENPYVFNGDFVDRGRHGIEVFIILLVCLLVHPDGVFLNRGNHEDHVMNQRYGFIREVRSKYKQNADRLLRLIENVYRWLPLATLINKRALVVHGGISDATDLCWLRNLDRHKYVSLLRPPISTNNTPIAHSEVIDKMEWKQVFDVLWSDPQPSNGCHPNALRGAGTYFGPDVTEKFLTKQHLDMLIRSHECKPMGYELTHNNQVITIFSASNYYETGSNKGAYLKLVGSELQTHFVQFSAAAATRGGGKALTFRQTIGLVEASALRELVDQIKTHKARLENVFRKIDMENTGLISVADWCREMELATGLSLPWRLLRSKIASLDESTGKVKYRETFDANCTSGTQDRRLSGPSVGDTLYRNKRSLEAVFRIIDKDNSGYISMDEFSEACSLLVEHLPAPAPLEEMLELCRAMDMNKDGLVDLNEFLEAFRLVDSKNRVLDPLADPEADDSDDAEELV